MTRRVSVRTLSVCALLATGLLATSCSNPAPPAAESTTQAPKPATTAPKKAAPKAEVKAPAEDARPAEPRRRDAKPAPEAAAAPAEAPAAPAADAAMLRVEVDVPDAQVFVDRVFIGKAPLTTTDVKPGSHRLNVSAAGYEGIAQSLDVKPGMQSVTIKLREVRLDASLDVVHKHRMGSCKGRLVATPQGIRYVTDDKDDTFTTPLLDLDTFEVDYLAKNLRIKLKGGKRFDFTDPEGNADHLFVFHRDVDKARERLKKGDTPAQP